MSRNAYTFLGIFLSYTAISGVNWLFNTYTGERLGNAEVIAKELLILSLVGVLFLLIKKGEKLGLDSIGLYFHSYKKSLLRALFLTVLSFLAIAIAIFISQQIGWRFGESKAFESLSPWTVTLIVLRAGIAEEVFMRGYLLERIQGLTGRKTLAVLLSLLPFALLHYPGQGWAGVLVSLAGGGVLTWFYLWKRDLKANIIAHFTVDFIPNVAVQWFL
jgi:membrane protease YdiL (CAAX protease family)